MAFFKRFRKSRSSKGLSRSMTPPPDYETATRRPTLPPPYESEHERESTSTPVQDEATSTHAPETLQHENPNPKPKAKPRKRDALRKWLKRTANKTQRVRLWAEHVAFVVGCIPLMLCALFWLMWEEDKPLLFFTIATFVAVVLVAVLA
ncbi:hypothetical protein BJY00DRAFT_313808 [Aspergillus carlsbadensis]|nr:hypothetical protein BJY00DRAFT_313808 [Aspergillus carlsbadensis]